MSADETQIAGNYATSGGSGDAAFVAERLAAMQSDAGERRTEAATHEETRQHVEAASGDTLGTIDVRGDEITLERPVTDDLGAGHIARLRTMDEEMTEAHAESFLAVLDALNGVTPDEYDRGYWYDLPDRAIGQAFEQAVRQSKGGREAGK